MTTNYADLKEKAEAATQAKIRLPLKSDLSLRRAIKIDAACQAGPCSARDLADSVGLNTKTAGLYMSNMRQFGWLEVVGSDDRAIVYRSTRSMPTDRDALMREINMVTRDIEVRSNVVTEVKPFRDYLTAAFFGAATDAVCAPAN